MAKQSQESLLDEMIVPKVGGASHQSRLSDLRLSDPRPNTSNTHITHGSVSARSSRDPRLKNDFPPPSSSFTREAELEEPPPPKVSRLEATVPLLRRAVDKALGVQDKDKCLLGVRRDIYEPGGSSQTPVSPASFSYHQPVNSPQHHQSSPDTVNIQEVPSSTVMLEEKFSDTETVSSQGKIPDSTVTDLMDPQDTYIKLSPKCEEKEKGQIESSIRCNFCPSPGLVSLDMKMVHQATHVPACFSCAACSGKRKFEEFDELVRHIHTLHAVTDSEMVLETIILPEVEGGLRMFKCGVTNCGKVFTAQAEIMLRSHMEHRHGAYYIKVGKGKYILRFCRICGEDRLFSSEKELDSHIEVSHPPEQFGQHLESDSDTENTTVVKHDPDGEDLTANLLDNLTKPRPAQAEPSSSAVKDSLHAEEEELAVTATERIKSPGSSRQQSVEEGEIQSPRKSPERSRSSSKLREISQRKYKRSKKNRSSSSESHLSSDGSAEVKKKKKKEKKAWKVKKSKLSRQEKKFKEKIETFSPDDLKTYIREMKEKTKRLKEKKLTRKLTKKSTEFTCLPDPNVPFQSSLNGRSSHFYCLICSSYTGKLPAWLQHRATREHVELYMSTRDKALKKFNCSDIDMQECVIGERKFSSIPAGQCRECLEIFWDKDDHGKHLRDGRCIKTLEEQKLNDEKALKDQKKTKTRDKQEKNPNKSVSISQERSPASRRIAKSPSYSFEASPLPSRSPSPHIKWKPLPKPSETGASKWKPLGESSIKTVFERSPTPDKISSPPVQRKEPPVSKTSFPKFMLDGKTAYYICKLCKNPVGNVLAWMEHKKSTEHKAAYRNAVLTDKMDEAIISGTASVLHKFGDACNKCWTCNANYPTNAQLYCHEQLESHKAAVKKAEVKDREEIRKYGGMLSTLFYCDLCLVTVCDLPSTHQVSQHHVTRLRETTQCLHCSKRLDPSVIILHVDAFHPDAGFQCKKCPTKFRSGDNLLEHASQHLRRRIICVDELLDLKMYTIPEDLRRMKCRSCREGVFLGQDSTEVINHVLGFHPEVKLRDMNSAVEFSCQLCLQFFGDEKELTDHIFNRHTNRLSVQANCTPPMNRFVKTEEKKTAVKREFKEVKEPSLNTIDRDVRERKNPVYKDRDIRVKQELGARTRTGSPKRRSPPRSYRSRTPQQQQYVKRSPPPGRYNSRSPSRHRSPERRYSSGSPSRHYSSRSPRRTFQSNSPHRSYKSKSPISIRYNSRSPKGRHNSRSPHNTWSNRPQSPISSSRRKSRHSKGRRSQDISPRRSVKRRNSGSINWSRSRSRDSSPPSKRVKNMSTVNSEISKQLDKTQEESKLLNSLKKKLISKKSKMEDDLRAKLENRKVKMLDSRPEGVKHEKVEGEQPSRVCPFCMHKLSSDDDLLHHLKIAHQEDMFGCSKCSTSLQSSIGWSVEVLLQHLALQHKLNVSISEAISNYVEMPSNLHRINCKLCPPPYILGTEGFWLGSDLQQCMESVENHFDQVHLIKEKSQVVNKLELACRGCDTTFPHSGRMEWVQHVKRDHERLNRRNGPRKMCNYCGEKVVETEAIRHVKEAHKMETFQCKACLEVDPTCFPFSDTIKEMMQHMVMKHGDQFSSYYDHMVYPLTLYGSLCSGKDCSTTGKVIAFDAATIGKHLREHQDAGGGEVGEFYCRCCDRIKEKFKTLEEVKAHIEKKHKTVIKWKEANGNT
eukprot:GFUD01107133.1.p1 GENE.GFUD01107133.1~~GFUD01107133.1.p1  ORF type:complete len:1924 (+),score=566.33 GFUD01107133.1:661-5772(+)